MDYFVHFTVFWFVMYRIAANICVLILHPATLVNSSINSNNFGGVFLNLYIYLYIYIMPCLVTQSCLTLCSPMDYSLTGSSVHGDSPDKNTGVLPCPPPGDLPYPGIEPRSPALLADSLHLSHQGSPIICK